MAVLGIAVIHSAAVVNAKAQRYSQARKPLFMQNLAQRPHYFHVMVRQRAVQKQENRRVAAIGFGKHRIQPQTLVGHLHGLPGRKQGGRKYCRESQQNRAATDADFQSCHVIVSVVCCRQLATDRRYHL
jgi:hypothetical protein